nr:p74 envelope protein [Heliothis virescens nudivirus]
MSTVPNNPNPNPTTTTTTYTQLDIANASKFSYHRKLLMLLHKLNEKYPFLASHLKVNVRAATDADYYIPPAMASEAIFVEAEITKQLCESISCNSSGVHGPCKKTDAASYYRLGESENFEVQCNPACFHLFETAVHTDDGTDKPHNVRYRWSETSNTCNIVPFAATWMEIPRYRSSELYAPRLNDLDTGFDYEPSTDTYHFNKYYCDVYYEAFDPDTRTCYTKWYNKLANIIVGDAVIKLINAGLTAMSNGNGKTLPPLEKDPPPAIDDKWTVSGWRKNVDPNFKLPPIDVTVSDLETMNRVNHRSKRSPNTIPMADNVKIVRVDDAMMKSKPKPTKPSTSSSTTKNQDIEKLLNLVKSLNDTSGADRELKNALASQTGKQTKFESIILSLLNELTSADFAASVAVDVGVTQLASQLKTMTVKAIQKLVPLLQKKVATMAIDTSELVLGASFKVAVRDLVVPLTVRSLGTIGVYLTKSLAMASTGVGVVLLITQLFSILLTFWDPLGFNNMYTPDYLHQLYENSKMALRSQLKTNRPVLTFDYVCSFLLTEEDLFDASIESYTYTYRYLDALEVNSDGARINKGNVIDVGSIEFEKILTRAKLFTVQDFEVYESHHKLRRQAFDTINRYTGIAVGIGVVLIVLRVYLLGVLMLLLSVALVSVSYANIAFNVWQWITDRINPFKV